MWRTKSPPFLVEFCTGEERGLFFAFLFLIPVAKLIISILRGLRGITVEERGRLVLNLKRDKIRNLGGRGDKISGYSIRNES